MVNHIFTSIHTNKLAVTAHEEANKRAQEVAKKYESKKVTSFPAHITSKGAVAVLNWTSSLGRKNFPLEVRM